MCIVPAFRNALRLGRMSIAHTIADAPAKPGLYRILSEDTIQYIGVSNNIRRRLEEHKRGGVWKKGNKVQYSGFRTGATRQDALSTEQVHLRRLTRRRMKL